VNADIRRYLDEHGATYTPEALRRGLLDAGYDPVEVDTALQEWQARASGPASIENRGGRFWGWALGLHVAVLAVIGLLSFAIGSFAANWGLLVVLAVVLLIGLGISGLVGRGVLQGRAMMVALVVPAISALLIGGSCLAIGGYYLLRAPPRTGGMEVHIDDPLSFDGSGTATCQDFGKTSGFLVSAAGFPALDGSFLEVSIGASSPGVPDLSITLTTKSETLQPVGYSTIFSTQLELDASADGLSGTLRFEGLEPGVGEQAPGGDPTRDPISGIISWSCD
jgi:hypothetical protein